MNGLKRICEALKSIHATPSGWPSLFLVQTGDNVLDCKLALDDLADAIHVIEQGLSHRFDGLERYLDKTFDFFLHH